MKEELILIRSDWFTDYLKVNFIVDGEIYNPVDDNVADSPFDGTESLYEFEQLLYSIIVTSTIRSSSKDDLHKHILLSIESSIIDFKSHENYEQKKTIVDIYMHKIVSRSYKVISYDFNSFHILDQYSYDVGSSSVDYLHIQLEDSQIKRIESGSGATLLDNYYLSMIGYLVYKHEINDFDNYDNLFDKLESSGVSHTSRNTGRSFIKTLGSFKPKNNSKDKESLKRNFIYHLDRISKVDRPKNLNQWKGFLFDNLFASWGCLEKNKFMALISNDGDLQTRISDFIINKEEIETLFNY